MNNLNKDLGLYIHIPFCEKKCDYCDFLSAPATKEAKKRYVEALLIEIESYRNQLTKYTVPTIFFGGGTPSCIEAEDILRVMDKIRDVFYLDTKRLEATIEMNPGTLTKEKLLLYKEAGINRLSIGLQSVNNEELKLLGRIHSYEEFLDNYLLARELGFTNINIDLMSALPGQTLSSWENTLTKIVNLKPEHISAYSLIIEEGTKFFETYKEGAKDSIKLPSEEVERKIYYRTEEILEENGYHRYEITNYAKPGYECAHNSSYWKGTEYLGLGLGASSLMNGIRFSKEKDMNRYLKRIEQFKERDAKQSDYSAENSSSHNFTEHRIFDLIGLSMDINVLSDNDKMEEFMFLGLRMCEGVSKEEFEKRFIRKIEDVYGKVLNRLEAQGLVKNEENRIKLTRLGIDVSNVVLSEFLL